MNQTIWLTRHGNRLDFVCPEWYNKANKRYDPPLSRDGILQAQELAQRLGGEAIKHIFVSPFFRAIQTGNEVAKILDLALKIERGLGEWLNPDWMTEKPVTHSREELSSLYPRIDWNYQSQVIPQYPETELEMRLRAAKTIQKIISQFDQELLLVGHSASIVGISVGLIEEDLRINTPLCGLVKLVNQGNSWKLELNGDISHLSQSRAKVWLV
jgi:broad specificity phosphatase PhoE